MAGKKARGKRAKTRAKIHARGKPTVTQLLRTFEVDSPVQVVINGAVHKGMPFRRFNGLTGRVLRMQGRAAVIKIRQGAQWCELVVNPIHLKEIMETKAGGTVA